MVIRILIALAIAFGLVNPAPSFVTFDSTLVRECDEREWSEFHTDAYDEFADEFTALFNSYETKWSKNNRLMIRTGDSGSFKFAAKGM